MSDEHTIATIALSRYIEQHPEDFDKVIDKVEGMIDASQYLIRKSKYPNHEKQVMTKTYHKTIDERVAKEHENLSCRKGCSFCCYYEVEVTSPEAQLLIKSKRPFDYNLAERQAQAKNWKDLPYEDRRCVFLSNSNTCTVYEFRPAACRKYAVNTDPKFCDSKTYPGGDVGVLCAVNAEITASVLYNIDRPGSLPKKLLEAISK